MRRLAMVMALLLVAAACGGSTGTSPSTVTTTPAQSATTTPPSPAATTTVTEPDDGRAAFAEAGQALVDFIDEHGVAATPVGSGTLDENGAFVDDFGPDGNPAIDLDIRMLRDTDGLIWFAVFGDFDQLSSTWIEFDAVTEDGFTVVAETSVIGPGIGPAWVETAPAGSVVVLEVPVDGVQSLRAAAGQDINLRSGFLLRGHDIGVWPGSNQQDAFLPPDHSDITPPGVRISAWMYLPIPTGAFGTWEYAHVTFEVTEVPEPKTFEELLGLYLRALILAELQAAELLIGGLGPADRVIPILRIVADRG